ADLDRVDREAHMSGTRTGLPPRGSERLTSLPRLGPRRIRGGFWTQDEGSSAVRRLAPRCCRRPQHSFPTKPPPPQKAQQEAECGARACTWREMASWCSATPRLLLLASLALESAGTRLRSAGSSSESLWYNLDGYVYGDGASKLSKPTVFLTADDARGDSAADLALAASEASRSKTRAGQESFAQLGHKAHKSRRQMPGDDYGDGYEYGDREMNARNEDSADYSVHQFLANDDARDGPVSTGDDSDAAAEVRRSRELASQDHFNSENTPAADDDFIQLKSKSRKSRRQMPGDDYGDGYEYGDCEMNARNEDSADYPSVHQFLANDDARDGPVSTGDDSDAAAEVRRSRELASQDHFNSENTPAADDDFIQLKSKSRKRRRQMPGDDYGDGYEYGDREMNARNEDSADYSVHQFLANDDARDGPVSTGDDSDAAAEVRRSRELASQDHSTREHAGRSDRTPPARQVLGQRRRPGWACVHWRRQRRSCRGEEVQGACEPGPLQQREHAGRR
ncbi:unnamed protein product, partial [Prorocentrum cordatum]